MLKIVHNVIYHRRGDTGGLDASGVIVNGVKLSDLTQPYTAIFTLKKSYADSSVLQKTLVLGQLYLLHEDTQLLDFGDYVCDIQVTMGSQSATLGPFAYHLLPDVTT